MQGVLLGGKSVSPESVSTEKMLLQSGCLSLRDGGTDLKNRCGFDKMMIENQSLNGYGTFGKGSYSYFCGMPMPAERDGLKCKEEEQRLSATV